jgi:uncharacterized RDD family membrane protein YckC
MVKAMYYVLLDGMQTGPLTLEELQAYRTQGRIDNQTFYWTPGMPEWQPLVTLGLGAPPAAYAPPGVVPLSPEALPAATAPLPARPAASAGPDRVIAGFWRRIAAGLVDILLLAVLGFVLGLFLDKVFSRLGDWGFLVGLVICVGYFGILNSRLGKGATIGKRLLGIEVVNAAGATIGPGPSLLRYFVLASPFILNHLVEVAISASDLWLAGTLGFVAAVLFFVILYLLAFNRPSRQSLHDWAAGTYVVRREPAGAAGPLPFWSWHYLIVGCGLFLMAATGGLALLIFKALPIDWSQMLYLQKSVLACGQLRDVSVTDNINFTYVNGQSSRSHTLSVGAISMEDGVDADTMAKRIAAVVLANDPNATHVDALVISVSTGYNIGIWSQSTSNTFAHTPEEWETLVQAPK